MYPHTIPKGYTNIQPNPQCIQFDPKQKSGATKKMRSSVFDTCIVSKTVQTTFPHSQRTHRYPTYYNWIVRSSNGAFNIGLILLEWVARVNNRLKK